MPRENLSRHGSFWIAAAISLVSLLASGVSSVAKSVDTPTDEPALLRKIQTDLLFAGHLHEAARVTGQAVQRIPMPEAVVGDLQNLVQMSSDVVVAEFLDSHSGLAANGSMVTTAYRLQVQRALKGRYSNDSTIILNVPGGRIQFADKAWLETRLMRFSRPASGSRYLVFMKPAIENVSSEDLRAADPYPVMELAHLSSSLFEFSRGSVIPHGAFAGVARQATTMSERDLVLATIDAIKNTEPRQEGTKAGVR